MRGTPRFKHEVALISLSAGIIVSQWVPVLPHRLISASVGGCLLAVAILLFVRGVTLRLPLLAMLCCALGASYSLFRAELRISDALPRTWEARDIEIIGVIDELPQINERGIRFAFRVEQTLTPEATVPARIALGWYKPSVKELSGEALPTLLPGESWRWTVRLKRPHGNVNPAGFDAEAWMLERNLRAAGSVQTDQPMSRLSANSGAISDHLHRLRAQVRERMLAALAERPYAGVLIALAIGDQRAVSDKQWALFNATGIGHLLSISGAHVTLFAGWCAALVLLIWRRSATLSNRIPAQKAAALVGALIAVLYALFTGFEVPAQRTCYMLLTWAAALMLSRALSPWWVLCLSLAVVLVIDPWAAISAGFWFSFFAVGLLLYVTQGRVMPMSPLRIAVNAQLAVTIGLAPIALAFFQQVSWFGPIANAVAIPLVSFVIVPLTLLWMLLPIDALLWTAHALMAALANGLQWVSTLATPLWSQHAPPFWAVALALLGALWLFAPFPTRLRGVGLLWILPLFTVTPLRPNSGEFSAAVLDVGQGTSVVVRTAHLTLVYDTGPRWSDDTDAGSRIIAPYLRASGSGRIDGLVVSHLDSDHSGGAKSLLLETQTTWLLSSMFFGGNIYETAFDRNTISYRCRAGQSWVWDEVRFTVLHPADESYGDGALKTNDRSCVIKVASQSASLLLTGDIETVSERALVASNAQSLKSDALLIPHHGSLTSSTPEFLAAVSPRVAFINNGYRNRFGHPREAVLQRYADQNIAVHRTDWHGAITMNSADGFRAIRRERDVRKRYWIDRADPADSRPIE